MCGQDITLGGRKGKKIMIKDNVTNQIIITSSIGHKLGDGSIMLLFSLFLGTVVENHLSLRYGCDLWRFYDR